MDAETRQFFETFKEGCVAVITDFKSKTFIPDLPIMFANEGIHETFQEAISSITYQVATISEIDETAKTELIGTLTKYAARMVHAQVSNNEKTFVKEGALLLESLNKLINTARWLQTGMEQLNSLQNMDTVLSESQEGLSDKLAPMTLLIDVARALTAQEEYNAAMQNDCDEECSDDCEQDCQDEA